MQELKTERLIIRALRMDDATALFNVRNNPLVNLYIARSVPNDVDEIKDFILDKNDQIAQGNLMYWAIAKKEDDKLIGSTCLFNFSVEHNCAEVGYELHPDYHSKGIMNEVLNVIISYSFEDLRLDHIEAYTQKGNASSRRLLEKFGFEIDPLRKDPNVPENLIYIKNA